MSGMRYLTETHLRGFERYKVSTKRLFFLSGVVKGGRVEEGLRKLVPPATGTIKINVHAYLRRLHQPIKQIHYSFW